MRKSSSTSTDDCAVVKSIKEIGDCIGKEMVAEFVEEDETLEILREIGADDAHNGTSQVSTKQLQPVHRPYRRSVLLLHP